MTSMQVMLETEVPTTIEKDCYEAGHQSMENCIACEEQHFTAALTLT